MAEVTISKEVSNRIGRAFAMLYTRTTMYNIEHPFAEQSLAGFYKEITHDLNFCSPLVLIMHKDQFFVEEEQLDPRINTSKLLQHFKKGAIHSISFEKGLSDTELKTFIGIFTDLANNPDAEAMKKAFGEQSVSNIKINHVFYKKITEEDEVVNRRVLEEATATANKKTQEKKTGKVFEMMAESVLMQELEQSLSLSSIIQNPTEASQKMIDADRAVTAEGQSGSSDAVGSGSLIMHNLKNIQQEVGKASEGMSGASLQQLAVAVFDMKKDLLSGIEAQKAAGVIFEDVEAIEDEANELTDKVLIQLIKDEYQQGKISVPRLSQIIRRLIPDPKELKRLIPKIKDALVEEGMPLDTFLQLSGELKTELKSEELSKVLEKSAEEMGISGETLIREVSLNPKGAAELIYLASEIRKGTGDETVMTDLLVDYVERVGSKIAIDAAEQQGEDGGKQLRGIITSIESTLLKQLKNKNIDAAVVHQVAERLNDRMEACIEKLESRFDTMQQGVATGEGGPNPTSVLEIFEEDADEEEELKALMQKVRSSVEDEGLDENDFEQIHEVASEVMTPYQKQLSPAATPELKTAAPLNVIVPKGILKHISVLYMLEKEVARSSRYKTPFSILMLSIYEIVPDIQVDADTIPETGVMSLILEKLTPHIRESDIFGLLDNNKVIVILPMTNKEKSRKAMGRLLRIIHEEKYIYDDIPFTVKLAGASIPFDADVTPSLKDYLNRAESEINDMAMRLKNVQSIY